MTTPLWNLQPIAHVALMGVVVALGPLAWIWLRNKQAGLTTRLAALTLLTLFLTFDLVVFGAFTRLTDSGLGCPDWPGCYGHASPVGAHDAIHAAQTAMPTGPVTHTKAWIEMIHRYLASAVGVLIVVLTAASWRARLRHVAVWASLSLAWVLLQGLFGALTVTLKLYPAVVTLHLLLGLGLLALLAVQVEVHQPQGWTLGRGLQRGALVVAGLLLAQVALGGWVSTNYAVLACADFPTCQGQWWPPADFASGFTVLHHLGEDGAGGLLTLPALTAIHLAHRVGAVVLLGALALLAWALRRQPHPQARRWGVYVAAGAAWQLASGLSNVVLGWPLLAALAHTAGAAALVVLLTLVNLRARRRLVDAPASSASQPSSAPISLQPGVRAMQSAP
jgi:cytochrome c oxidase assembly protein subunit 15